jgi:large subunit ribosomal protein L17
MRHLKRGRKLNRTPSHRKAMVRNLVSSLFIHGRVITTPAKAKEARPFAEKLITLAKNGSMHARRRAVSLLDNTKIVGSLFNEIGPRYKDRPGGYSRILRLAKRRVGDSAPQVLFELVESEMSGKAKAEVKAEVAEKPAEKAVEEVKAETEAPAEEAPESEIPAEESNDGEEEKSE